MAVREDIVAQIRQMIALDPRITEKRMFGGICFLLDGKILVAARRTGSLMVQCGAEAAPDALARPGVTRIVMAGRPAANFVDVDSDDLETEAGLRHWIDLAERYVSSRPPAPGKPVRRARPAAKR